MPARRPSLADGPASDHPGTDGSAAVIGRPADATVDHASTAPPASSEGVRVVAPARRTFAPSPAALATVGLFVLFFGIYSSFGSRLVALPVSRWRTSFMFHADPARVSGSLVAPPQHEDHARSNVHPLFSLLYNPLGSGLTAALGSSRLAITLLVATAGALGVALARLFFSRVGFTLPDAVILAGILGVTASHAFFGIVPETYAFTAAGLVAMFWLLARGTRHLAARGIVHLLAFASLISNIVESALASIFLPRPGVSRTGSLVRAAGFSGSILLVAGTLSLLQLALYPRSTLFFMPASLQNETRYLADATDPAIFAARAGRLGLHMFSYSFVAPRLCFIRATPPVRSLPTVTFDSDECTTLESVSPLGQAALAIWVSLLAVAVVSLVRLVRQRRSGSAEPVPEAPVLAALGLAILAHVGLHLVYGDNFFLYSSTWTFEILAIVALLVRRLAYCSARGRLAFRGVLLLFLALLAGHSAMFLETIIGIFARARL